jgi:hypothetical protein
MSRICSLATAVLALGTATASAQPAKPQFETRKVDGTENVYIYRYANHQSMFVVSRDGVIATDPIGLARPQAVTAYIAEIKKVTDKADARAGKCWQQEEKEFTLAKYASWQDYEFGRSYVARRYCALWGRGTE